MIGALKRTWDNFRGAGEAAVTVPPMDGALRPNRLLEEAPVLLDITAPDDIATNGKRTFIAAGRQVLSLDVLAKTTTVAHEYASDITAISLSPNGALAVALADGEIRIESGETGKLPRIRCVTAMAFISETELAITQGSTSRSADEWKHDLMQRGSTGTVQRINLKTGEAKRVADKLAWPYGIVVTPDGKLVASESWRNRLVIVGEGSAFTPILDDLPGYPARITPAADGGYWLAIFAPRNQIIEFIQREPEFLRRMMTEVPPEYWAAPTLKPSATFLEPLQGGAQKHFGMLKPWAPSRSYGLVARLDRQFRPTMGYHSRADGTRHGVTQCAETPAGLLVASKGGDAILLLDPHARSVARDQLGEH
ncbi:hypothetical protein [Rhizobium sp. LjRoot254]|uniref:hypothetical protein n=1 Tax=Rhizobium sp. LjRoot254 TaxID=3342297 RepID=UPI003ED13D1E